MLDFSSDLNPSRLRFSFLTPGELFVATQTISCFNDFLNLSITDILRVRRVIELQFIPFSPLSVAFPKQFDMQ